MKHIEKSSPPESYSTWCQTQRELGVNFNFGSIEGNVKKCLHDELVKEQGSICAYTMKRIKRTNSHIEHIHPQHVCSIGQDLDYRNLIACFPNGNPKAKCSFGAEKKGKWWENNGYDFISPLNENCELKFYYKLNGKVKPVIKGSLSAKTTIKILNLNFGTLKKERRQAIEEFIYGGAGPLSPQEADIAISVICKPNKDGELREFCMAIHDALFEYLEIFRRISQLKTTK